MAIPTLSLSVLLLLVLILAAAPTESKPRSRHASPPRLSTSYYRKTCPDFEKIMRDVITSKQISSPTTAAAALRLIFHDCLLNGCDASVLLSSTPFSRAERDAEINLSLPGDAFDAIVRAKTALELACPATVSCSDILAFAVRDLVTMLGGPFYSVPLGRRDSRTSSAASVAGKLPTPSMSVPQILKIFASRGFSARETVALSGAHTVGFSHCKEFSAGIYNFSRSSAADPHYNPRFATALRKACDGYGKNPTISVFNDIMTPNKFDNVYFQNLRRGLGLLKSDHGLYGDPATRPFVDLYADDEKRFFADFARAMEKLSVYGVKTGRYGEIRRRCDQVN